MAIKISHVVASNLPRNFLRSPDSGGENPAAPNLAALGAQFDATIGKVTLADRQQFPDDRSKALGVARAEHAADAQVAGCGVAHDDLLARIAVHFSHGVGKRRSEEHTSELQSLMRI